jgi:class 3 adenylate cyclase
VCAPFASGKLVSVEGSRDVAAVAAELASRANVPLDLARDILDRELVSGDDERSVGRARLLHPWVQAGLPLDVVSDLIDGGKLSLAFLDTPAMETGDRLDRTFADLCADRDLPLSVAADLHVALGLEPPDPDGLAGEDDAVLLDLMIRFEGAGAPREAVMRLYAVYADNMRRLAKAEAEFYETNIEGRLRAAGLGEQELMRLGGEFGARINELRERAISLVYFRHREHVWFEHAINHVEQAMVASAVEVSVTRPPSICFVDLTGYTRLTEERGDEFAADTAGRLAALVKDISRRHGGRAIRWLGDGGMFHFREASAAVAAALDMVAAAPEVGLPPAHLGIHTGPVIAQDGDVYGRTVNIASRIASFAQGGQVVVSEETAEAARAGGHVDPAIRFEALGSFPLKGLLQDMPLFQVFRDVG